MIINKLAHREYQITDTYVAGVALTGAEVKSLREERGSLRDGYAKIIKGELFLVGADIPQYSHYSGREYDAKRSRKLLMKSSELLKIQKQIEGKPLTLIPLKLFFKGRWAKCEIGVGKGKREWEKREDIKKRDTNREMAKAMRNKI
ncbi:MAG: SsrA-binding protein SmpB [bacterium]